MPPIADTIVPTARLALGLAQKLTKDIEPTLFATLPKGVRTNHPAFVYGHLAIYPDRAVFPLLGRTDLVKPSDDFAALFKGGLECRDDPRCTIYPAMETILARYFERNEAALAAVAEATDKDLSKPLPADHFFAGKVPTVGGVLNFLLNAHPMMHLGQVSAWRRMMGLGSAM